MHARTCASKSPVTCTMPAEKRLFLRSCTARRAPSSSHTSPRTGTLRIQRLRPLQARQAGRREHTARAEQQPYARALSRQKRPLRHAAGSRANQLATATACARMHGNHAGLCMRGGPVWRCHAASQACGALDGRGGGVEQRADALAGDDLQDVARLGGGADDHAAASRGGDAPRRQLGGHAAGAPLRASCARVHLRVGQVGACVGRRARPAGSVRGAARGAGPPAAGCAHATTVFSLAGLLALALTCSLDRSATS